MNQLTSPPSRVHIYVDETGDRGSSPRSSPIFGMAGIVLDETGASLVRSAVEVLRQDFRVPENRILSFKNYVKTRDRRKRAAEVLGAVEGLKVCYVYSVKSALWPGTYLNDPSRFYNYVSFKTYKSLLWAARAWKGTNAKVWTRFGHVKGHDHRSTAA